MYSSLRSNLSPEALEPIIILEVFIRGYTRRSRIGRISIAPRILVTSPDGATRGFIPEGGGRVRPLLQNSRGTLYRAVFRPWRWGSRASGEIEPRRMQNFPIGSRGMLYVFFDADRGYVQRPVQIASGLQTIRITTSLRAVGMLGTGMGQTLIDEDGGAESGSESGSGMATLGYIALGAGALYLLAKK